LSLDKRRQLFRRSGRPVSSSRSGCSRNRSSARYGRQSAPIRRSGVGRVDKDRPGAGEASMSNCPGLERTWSRYSRNDFKGGCARPRTSPAPRCLNADVGPEAAKRFLPNSSRSRRSSNWLWKESVTRLGYCYPRQGSGFIYFRRVRRFTNGRHASPRGTRKCIETVSISVPSCAREQDGIPEK
jgi:hypothetical protein